MDASQLFADSLEVIERAARAVCRRARLGNADTDDFLSAARLLLIENDYSVLRQYQGRSSLATYLAVVFQRLLADERMRTRGRFRPSREAERMGAAGILLETLVRRDGRSLDEALPIVQAAHPALARGDLRTMEERLPARLPRPRPVTIDDRLADLLPAPERTDARARHREAAALQRRTEEVLRAALGSLPVEDRVIVRLRFSAGVSIADISRMLRQEQRPLYRRLESLLARLRAALAAAGLAAGDLAALIGTATCEMDFGLADAENPPAWQSSHGERLVSGEEPP